MDMKKILQAFDGASSTTKPAEGSNDMKKFMTIVEGTGPLNRLSQAESIAVNHYSQPTRKEITSPVLNVAKDAKPSMTGKYFKQVEQELAEQDYKFNTLKAESARALAERVIERIVPGQEVPPGYNRLTGKPNPPAAPAVSKPAAPAGPRGTNLKYSVLKKLQTGTYKGFAPKLSPEEIEAAIQWKEANDETNESVNEADVIDTVTLDVPLLIRLLEYAREDAQTDMDLHNVTEKLISMSKENETLTMDQYDAIVGEQDSLPAQDKE